MKKSRINEVSCAIMICTCVLPLEYQWIYDEGGYKYLTPDDMRWIDQNVKIGISKTPTLEENVIDVFFGGDGNFYKQHLITNHV